jgi:hypothetical protein
MLLLAGEHVLALARRREVEGGGDVLSGVG